MAPGDRNIVDLFADLGLALTGTLPGRKHDVIVAGAGYARISHARRLLDLDVRRYTNPLYPVGSAESFVELGYEAKIAPWWHVEPAVFGVCSLVKF